MVLQDIWKHKPRGVICTKINRTILCDKDFFTLRDGKYINNKIMESRLELVTQKHRSEDQLFNANVCVGCFNQLGSHWVLILQCQKCMDQKLFHASCFPEIAKSNVSLTMFTMVSDWKGMSLKHHHLHQHN
ncbi:uncharacterized protein LOC135687777 isoform X1 [Rhopilema esculentum]|uniref:uncharacterized protein LOC135687777 isoform X1 n=1 Tax=Rhopilema esculentum TaxID=499914 RepID=UPI0031E47583